MSEEDLLYTMLMWQKVLPLKLSRTHKLACHKHQTSYKTYKLLTPDVEETINEPNLDKVAKSFDNIGIRESGPSSSSGGKHIKVGFKGTDKLTWD